MLQHAHAAVYMICRHIAHRLGRGADANGAQVFSYHILHRNIAKICRHIAHRLGAGGRGADEVEAQGVGAVHAHHLFRVRVVFEPLYRAYIYIYIEREREREERERERERQRERESEKEREREHLTYLRTFET